jgi:SAM-dependent methyltransferase
MNAGLEYDEEASRRLEAIYVTPDVVAQRREVLGALELRPGERVLDIGSGPGFLAVDMGVAVGSSGQVIGIDISDSMIAISRARCAGQPIAKWVEFQVADVTKLPFSDGHFDVAVSTQVYEYVSDWIPTGSPSSGTRQIEHGGIVSSRCGMNTWLIRSFRKP